MDYSNAQEIVYNDIVPGYCYLFDDPSIGLDHVIGLCTDKSATGAVFLLDGEEECREPIPPRRGQCFYIISRDNSPSIKSQIQDVCQAMEDLKARSIHQPFCEADMAKAIEESDSEEAAAGFLNEKNFPAAIFNSIPYILNRNTSSYLSFALILYAIDSCTKSENERYSHIDRHPFFQNQEILFDVSNGTNNIALLRRMGRYIKYMTKWPALFEGDTRFSAVVNNWNSSKGYLSILPQLSPQFNRENVIDNRLDQILSMSVSEIGTPEIEFSICRNQSSVFPARIRLTERTIKGIEAFNEKHDHPINIELEDHREKPAICSSDYPPVSSSDLQPTYQMILDWRNRKEVWTPIGTLLGTIESVEVIDKESNRFYTGYIRHKGNLIFFHSQQVVDQKVFDLLSNDMAVGTEVKFELAFNPARRKNMAPTADWIRLPEMTIEIPSLWSQTYNNKQNGLIDKEAIDCIKSRSDVYSSYSSLQPWLPVYESLIGNRISGIISPDAAHYNQYYIKESSGKVYGFRHIQVWDEDLYIAMLSPARNRIDWEKIPVICLTVPDPTRPERLLADQIILTGPGRKALFEQVGLQMVDNNSGVFLFSPRKEFVPQPVTQNRETDLNYGVLNVIPMQDHDILIHQGVIQSFYSINGTGKIQIIDSTKNLAVSYSQAQIIDKRLTILLEKQIYHKIIIDLNLRYNAEGDLVANNIRIAETEKNQRILSNLSIADLDAAENTEENDRNHSGNSEINNASPIVNETDSNQPKADNISFTGHVTKISMNRGNNMFIDITLNTPFYYLPDSRYDTQPISVQNVSLRLDKPYSVKDTDLISALSRGERGLICQFDIATFIPDNNQTDRERRFIAVNAELTPNERVRMGLTRTLTISPDWHEYRLPDCLLYKKNIGYTEDLYHINGWIVEATKNQYNYVEDEWFLTIALRRPIVISHDNKVYAFSHATVNTSPGNWSDQALLAEVKNKLSQSNENRRIVLDVPVEISMYLKRPTTNTVSSQTRVRLYACFISKPDNKPICNANNILKYIDTISNRSLIQSMTIRHSSNNSEYVARLNSRSSEEEYPINTDNVIDALLINKLQNNDNLEGKKICAILNRIDHQLVCIYIDQDGMINKPTTVHYPICIAENSERQSQVHSEQTGTETDRDLSLPVISGFDAHMHPYIRVRRNSSEEHWTLFNSFPSKENLRNALITDMGKFARHSESYRQVAYLAWLLWFDHEKRFSLRSAMGYAANTRQSRRNTLNTVGKLNSLQFTPWPVYNEEDVVPFLNFLFRLPETVESFSEASLDAFPNWLLRIEDYLGGRLTEPTITERRHKAQHEMKEMASWVAGLLYDDEEDFRRIDTSLPTIINAAYELLLPEERKQFNRFTEIVNGLREIPKFTRTSEKKTYIHKEYSSIKLAMQEIIETPSLFGTEVLYLAYEKLLQVTSKLFTAICGDEPVFNISTQCEVVPGSNDISIRVFVESSADSAAAHEISIQLMSTQEDPIFNDEEYILVPSVPEVCQIQHLESGEIMQASKSGWLFNVSNSVGVNMLHSFRINVLVDYSWDTLDKVEFNSERGKYLEVVPSTDWGKIKDPWNAVYPTTAQKDKSYVFGRNKDLEMVFEKIWDSKNDEFKSCNIVIYGQRRTGKSTFAYLFKSKLEELALQHPAIIAEPYDISGCLSTTDASVFNFDQLLSHIIDGVTQELPDDIKQSMQEVNYQFKNSGIRGMEEFCTALSNACAEYHQDMPHIFITLDEFTTLFKPLSIHEEYRSTVAALLSLQANYPITLIMVAIDHYTSMIKYYSHARSHVEEFNIHGLSEEGGIQLLSLKAETDGNYVLSSPLISEEYAKKIWEIAAGNPHIMINHFGHKLVEYLNYKCIYRLETKESFAEFIDYAFNSMHPKTMEDRISPMTEDGRFCYDERIKKIHMHLNLIILNSICEGMDEKTIHQIISDEINRCDELVYHPIIEKLLSYEGVVIPESVLNSFKESKLLKDCHISAEHLIEWLIERNVLQRSDTGKLQIVMPYYIECYNRKKEALLRLASKPANFL